MRIGEPTRMGLGCRAPAGPRGAMGKEGKRDVNLICRKSMVIAVHTYGHGNKVDASRMVVGVGPDLSNIGTRCVP